MARQSVSKHLAILEEASLVTTVRAAGEAALPQRRPDQRHRRKMDQQVRPAPRRRICPI
jgi:hypothetical protein